MADILVVDDDESIRDAVSFHMRKEGHDVTAAKDGSEALEKHGRQRFDLIILDIMMRGYSGFEVCSAIRDKDPSIPIIMLSAKGDLVDKSLGFKLGADDYITKPFEPAELAMRVNSCLRRSRVYSQGVQQVKAEGAGTVELGDLQIDIRVRQVSARGNRVDLTTREFDILAYLAQCPNTTFTRQQILDAVWGCESYSSPGVIAVFIRKLREKIEKDPSKPEHIITDWGVGYRIV